PAALARGGERPFGQPLAVGRIEEGEGKWLDRMCRTELRRIAAKDARHAPQAERLDIRANERARFRAVIDEQRKRRAARYRLETERPGAGEEIEHARTDERVVIGMHQDIEQRLAQTVGGGPDPGSGRPLEAAPAQPSTDNAHQSMIPKKPAPDLI